MTIRIRRVSDYRVPLAMDLLLFPSDDPVEDPESHIWFVGYEAGKPVCYASVKLLVETDAGTALLARVGVLRSHRGQGLQKRLIKAREAVAKAEGARVMLSYTASWNAPSMNSLFSCGYRAYMPELKWGSDNAVYFQKRLTT